MIKFKSMFICLCFALGGFLGSIAVEPTERPDTTDSTVTTEGASSVALKSKQKCKEYGEFVYVKEWDGAIEQYRKRDTCAIVDPLIVGGNDTSPREFPHQAMIGWGPQADPQWYCGGSLISPSYILTARHCHRMDPRRNLTIAMWVRLGDYKIGATDDEDKRQSKPVTLEVEKFISNPIEDIALIKLKSEVHFNEYIRPACLHTEYAIPKLYGIATGWGTLKYGANEPMAIDKKMPLQKVNLTFTIHSKCGGSDATVLLCAGGAADPGKDTCQGDSGGPLQIRLAVPHCMYSIVGVTSRGVECAVGFPGIYIRVSHFIEWIENTVWPEPL